MYTRQSRSLRGRILLGSSVAVVMLAMLWWWAQPIIAQAVGPVYALPGTLTRAVNRPYDTILTTANGTQYGLAGQTPDIEAQIVQYRSQGEEFEVKVWGDRFAAATEDDLELIIAASVQPAVPTPEATPTSAPTSAPTDAPTPTPTTAPTAAPTAAPTVVPTPAVPVGVVVAETVNVRSGPSTDYPRVGSVVAGQVCALTGRNTASTWWQVSCPSINGWVFGELMALAGPITQVPVVQVAPPPTPAPSTTFSGWYSTFYSGRELAGPVLVAQDHPSINFNWGNGSPARVPADNFSARFERTLNLEYGNYELAVTMDDGARVYVDDSLIINAWNEAGVRTRTAQLVLSGARRFRIEYFEAQGAAQIEFSLRLISSSEAWTASYYQGKGFNSTPILTRGESRSNSRQLDYNWGTGSPASNIPNDIFSARWEGTFNFEGGDYRFNAVSDDGIRVYIDGILVLDRWLNGYQGDVSNTFRSLGAGNHRVVVEYYEAYGDALVRVWWERIGSSGGGGNDGRDRDE